MCEYINCYKNVRLFQVHVCVFNQNVFILRLHIVDWNESPVLPSGSSFSSSLDAEGRCCMCVCVSVEVEGCSAMSSLLWKPNNSLPGGKPENPWGSDHGEWKVTLFFLVDINNQSCWALRSSATKAVTGWSVSEQNLQPGYTLGELNNSPLKSEGNTSHLLVGILLCFGDSY